MEDAVKLKVFIPLLHSIRYFRRAQKHVLIQWMQLVEGKRVFFRFKIVKIAYEASKCVAQLGVGLADTVHQVLRNGDVFLKINGRNPHANDLTTQTVGDLYRINAVS